MPNWAESEMSVVLPTENADQFESLFLGNKEENEKKNRYFARCFLQNCDRESNEKGLTRLFIQFDAAWSLHSCLIEGYPQESEETTKACRITRGEWSSAKSRNRVYGNRCARKSVDVA